LALKRLSFCFFIPQEDRENASFLPDMIFLRHSGMAAGGGLTFADFVLLLLCDLCSFCFLYDIILRGLCQPFDVNLLY